MRINRSLLNWGVFLIALGGIPLAVDQGWLDADLVSDLGQLWPLILVGIGLGLILRWTPFAWFGGALVAATFGIIFGSAIAAVPDDDFANLQAIIPSVASGACTDGDAGPGNTSESGVASDSAFALDTTLSCGSLSVARASDATWSLEADHDTDDAPRITESDRDGATARLAVSQDGEGEIAFLGQQLQSDWRVEVPAEAALAVNTTLNAAKGEFDTGAGPLTAFNGTYNASDVVMDLGAAETPVRAGVNLTFNASDGTLLLPNGDVAANVTLNASSLSVCVPEAASLRVDASSTLSSDDLASSGLEEAASDDWVTPGFDPASAHVALDISSTVSSLSIDRPETCP